MTDMFAKLSRQDAVWPISVTVITGVLLFICYLPMLRGPALLDEQFIINWLKEGSSDPRLLHSFLRWSGPDLMDRWWFMAQPLMIAIYRLGDGSTFALRLGGVLFHWHSAVIVFLIVRELTDGMWERRMPLLAVCAAVFFALFPLAVEAVSWIGGRPVVLATVGFVLSLYGYIRARHYREDRLGAYVVSVLAFFGFQTVLSGVWSMFLVFLLFELLYDPGRAEYLLKQQEEGQPLPAKRPLLRKDQLLWLAPYTLIALLFALISAVREPGQLLLHSNWRDCWSIVHALLFPIDRAQWHLYGREYSFLYILYSCPLFFFFIALWKDKVRRRLILFSLLWLLVTLLPLSGVAIRGHSLYGSRWLYLTAIPATLLISTMLTSFRALFPRRAPLAIGASILFALALTVFYCRHTLYENCCYRASGKVLRIIQENVLAICQKENTPYLVLRQVPSRVAQTKIVSPYHLIVMDAKTGLMRAPYVPAGWLKETLRRDQCKNRVWRYNEDTKELDPVDFQGHSMEGPLDGRAIAASLMPPLKFNKSAAVDDADNCLVLTSTTAAGPSVNIKTGSLSPLKGDYYYVDAEITVPVPIAHKGIAMTWFTPQGRHYERLDRYRSQPALINDNKFHHYLFGLDSPGWVTGGPITSVMTSFPSHSQVRLKEAGITDGAHLRPFLAFEPYPQQSSKHNYAAFCFSYPNDEQLGLLYLNGKSLPIKYQEEVTDVQGERGNALQLEILDQSGALARLYAGKSGTLLADSFPHSGIFEIRLCRQQAGNKYYSNSCYCLVDRENQDSSGE